MQERYHVKLWIGKEFSFVGKQMDAVEFTKEEMAGWAEEDGNVFIPYLHANGRVTVNVETKERDIYHGNRTSTGAYAVITPIELA